MTTDRKPEYLIILVHELRNSPLGVNMNKQFLCDGYLIGCPRKRLTGRRLTFLNSYFARCCRAQGLFDSYLIATALADSSTVG